MQRPPAEVAKPLVDACQKHGAESCADVGTRAKYVSGCADALFLSWWSL